MSKHHHHPHEGHHSGTPPTPGRRPWHHSPFFWVAGFFILLGLMCFIFVSSPSAQPKALPPPPAPSGDSAK
jgi:hypothetical protein